jgi:hypothetical protein
MKERDDGKVRDIEDRLQKGEINHKEAYQLLIERGFTESGASIARPRLLVFFIALWIAFFALWLLPPISKALNLDFLAFFSGLQSFTIPLRADETIIFYREGPYQFIRHPQNLGSVTWFIFFPVILSPYLHFTILTVFAIASMIVYISIASRYNILLGIWRHIRRKKSK